MAILLNLFSVLLLLPLLGFFASGALFLLYRKSHKLATLFAAILWGSYTVYESLMWARILCTGECNIRIDLLLIYPLLALFTLFAAIIEVTKRVKTTTD
jgi:hypothetical protein